MSKIKKCKICSGVIQKITTCNVYCSDACRKTGVTNTKKKWKLLNPEKVKMQSKRYNNTPERKEYLKKYRRTPDALKRERESGLRYYQRSSHVERNGHLKRTFNITLEDYKRMLDSQNGVCAICLSEETRKSPNGGTMHLAVDHCHTTGKIRGLLCWNCNTSLGKFKDSTENLARAIEYLKKSKEEITE